MRDTEANEWDGVHITGHDTMLPLRNSISPPRETSIPSIKSTLMPPNHSKLTSVMIAQEYDDDRIFGYLGSTVHDTNVTHWMGDIARALVGRERYTLVRERERERERERLCVGIAVLLLRCLDPSRQLAPYGDILHDKLSFIISSNKMTQLQPQPRSRYSLRVSDGAADDSPCGCRQSIIGSEAALSTYCILLEVDQTRRRIASIASRKSVE